MANENCSLNAVLSVRQIEHTDCKVKEDTVQYSVTRFFLSNKSSPHAHRRCIQDQVRVNHQNRKCPTVFIYNYLCDCATAHCPKNNWNLSLKTESAILSIGANSKENCLASVHLLHPWHSRFLCGDLEIFWYSACGPFKWFTDCCVDRNSYSFVGDSRLGEGRMRYTVKI